MLYVGSSSQLSTKLFQRGKTQARASQSVSRAIKEFIFAKEDVLFPVACNASSLKASYFRALENRE